MDVKSKKMANMEVAAVSVLWCVLLSNVTAQVFCRLSDNRGIEEEAKKKK